MTYMVPSPNGGIENGDYLNADSSFFVIYTLVANAPGDFGSTASAAQNLQKLIETVMTTSIVKYINVTSAVVDLSVSGNRAIYNFGTVFNQASTTVYTIKFMIEQTDFTTQASLTTLLEANSAIVYFPTVSVPTSGGTVTLSAYELTNSSTTNTAINVYTLP